MSAQGRPHAQWAVRPAIARFMSTFCLLMVPAHLALYGFHHLPIGLVFAAGDVIAAVLWHLVARRGAANSSNERNSS